MKMQGYVEYISFNYEVLKRIRELDPTARTLYLWEGKKELKDLVNDRISGIDYSYYAYRQDKNLTQKAREAGLLTNVWTVNNAEELQQYYLLGVDYITTDEPAFSYDAQYSPLSLSTAMYVPSLFGNLLFQ